MALEQFAVDKFSSALQYEILVNMFSNHVTPLCLSLMHALAGDADPGNFRNIFNVAK